MREETKHAVVLAEHFGAEALEATLGARANDVVEQHVAQALPLVTVREDESDLGGRLTIRRLKTPDSDELDARHGLALGDEGQATPVVHVGEEVDPVGRYLPHHREEALVGRAPREALVERDQA